jgi:hypothetical protein
MLWSQLTQWPDNQVLPEAVRRHMRMTRYLDAREGDLTAWRFAKTMELMRTEGPPERVQGLREAIAEIDHVLRWMRNTDWPFR